MRFYKVLSVVFSTFLLLVFTQCGNQNTAKNPASDVSDAAAQAAGAAGNGLARPAKLSVAPPFVKINVAPESQLVNPSETTVLRMKSGSTVEIPAGIFVDAAGQPIAQPVEIRFREFHEPAEIIASGIPMKVRRPDGEEEWMQTAGMFEIEGFCENKPVKIAQGKSLTVNLNSEVPGNYDAWFFDPAQGNWVDIGNSTPTPNPDAAATERLPSADAERLKKLAARPPVAPVEFDKNKPALNFDVNVERFPELKKLRKVVWQYAGNNPSEDPTNNRWIFNTDWDEATLDESKTPNQYLLTLTSADKEYSIPVCPSQSGTELEKARAEYKKQVAEHEAAKKMLENRQQFDEEQAAFRRSLRVQGFGIHNYDILFKKEDFVPLYADFDFGPDVPEPLKKTITVYLITGQGRVAVALPFYDWSKLRISPSSDNQLMAVLPGDRLATFTQEDFNREMEQIKSAKNSRYVFKMRVEPKPAQKLEDLETQVVESRGDVINVSSGGQVSFSLSPNPASEQFTLRSKSGNFGQNATVTVLSTGGVQITRQNLPADQSTFNVQIGGDWNDGNYFVRVDKANARPQVKNLSVVRL